MENKTRLSVIFSDLKDHRVNRTKRHSLENIVFISMAAVICGAETWNEIEEFGHEKYDWFSKHLNLENGIPSHDTFNRFFSTLDPEKFEECFRKWVMSLGIESAGDIVSIDGKAIRGAKTGPTTMIHMVSAWSKNGGITLGQVKKQNKGSELAAIPELLDALFIEGSIVTIDAIGAVPVVVDKIIEKGADYCLQIKRNRWQTVDDIDKAFREVKPDSVHSTKDSKDHGRIETRKISVIHNPTLIRKWQQWEELKSIVLVEHETINKKTGKIEQFTAYYITSLDTDAKHIGNAIRSHWGIENSLHWMLDVAFSEDHTRKKNENAVVNFSLINKIALSMLKKEPSIKLGVKSKRLKAGWSSSYLEKVLGI